jgi:hypothetical protein
MLISFTNYRTCIINNSLLNIWFEAFFTDFSTYLKMTSKIYLRSPNYRTFVTSTTAAEFLVPDWGDKVNSGIGFSYRPAGLHRLAGRYDNPMPELTISPQVSDREFGLRYLASKG